MSNANLGVRIVLEDGAKAGFDALGLSALGLGHGLLGLVGIWNQLSPAMKGGAIGVGLLGLAFSGLMDVEKEAIDASTEFNTAMNKIELSVNGVDENVKQMQDTLVNLADAGVYSTTQLADGFAQLGIDGWDATQILHGMGEQGMFLGEALRTDTVSSFNLLGTAMEMYHAKAEEATQFTNDLTFAFYNGQKTVANLQQALNMVGPTASQLKVPFGELMDVLALLGQAGLKGGQGAASLNYYLTNLASPTIKAAKELENLGIITLNKTSPALGILERQLIASGSAGAKAVDQFDGTAAGLLALFNAGQKAGTIPLDKTFLEWGASTGLLKNALWDANGNFIGLTKSIELLGPALDKLNPEQRAIAISNLFNVRSGRDAREFYTNFIETLNKIGDLDKIRQGTDAMEKAAKVTDTFAGSTQRLGTTMRDAFKFLGDAQLGPLKGVVDGLQNLVHQFNIAGDAVHTNAALFLVVALVVTGLVFVVGAAAIVFSVFGAAIGMVLPYVAAVLGVVGFLIGLFIAFKLAIESNTAVMGFFRQVFAALGSLWGTFTSQLAELGKTLKLMEPVWNVLKVVIAAVAIVLGSVFIAAAFIVLGVFIALTVVIRVVIQVIAAVAGAIGRFFSMLGTGIHNIPAIWNAVWKTIQTAATSVWNNIVSSVTGFITRIRTGIQAGFNAVVGVVRGAINTVVGWFTWLYNHNYYFQMLVDFIHAKFIQARTVITIIWNAITSWLSGVWNTIVHTAQNLWNLLVSTIQNKLNEARNHATTAGHNILSVLQNAWNLIVSTAQGAWNRLLGVIAGFLGPIVAKATGIKDGVVNAISSLGGLLLKSGENAIHMLAQGIENAAAGVIQKAKDIAGNIAKILGFHSPPKEGPLADSDKYMPNMMKMYAAGIEQHLPLVHGAGMKVANALSGNTGAAGSRFANTSGGGSAGGVQHVHLHIDGKEITSVVMDDLTGQFRQNGMTRVFR
jgi:phage-related protein